MSRLPLVDPATATGAARDLLAAVQKGLGVTPNMTKAMANSPALLKGYLELSGALAAGALPAATRERLALTVAEENSCSYCLSAHTYLAANVAKLDDDDIKSARHAESADPAVDAALKLAATLLETRGKLNNSALTAARAAGLTDEQIAEVVGHVALNVLTNYFNNAVDVDIDFPVVTAHAHAS
ncbi:carboxymuconolactone decarboxylase family protein [Protofrankia symbiont of Coriaria ruscifolia]|uniref:carboxymuconolactone decarboxylase family protein n=1 Tax=Protofrankia symbiont of Coriaria ruscifolia TaxID=1306542 RepID=UPI001041A260|nr:carboxymuconolactone decarboxylase family protein [Protofrankia symbiont of Coriaria ruscifolia]